MTLFCFVIGIEDLALHLRDLAVCHESGQIYTETNLMQFDRCYKCDIFTFDLSQYTRIEEHGQDAC